MYLDPGVNWWGLGGVLVFYFAVLFIGIYASWRSKAYKGTDSEDVMLAGRDLGLFVGIFTMTGNLCGGPYVSGKLCFTMTGNLCGVPYVSGKVFHHDR